MLNLLRLTSLLAAVAFASCGPSEPAKPETSSAAPAAQKPKAEAPPTPAPAPEKKVAQAAPASAPVPEKTVAAVSPPKKSEGPVLASGPAPKSGATHEDHNWAGWRGPLQMGVSVEHHGGSLLEEKPVWVYESSGRGTPVIADGKVFSFGYRGEGADLVETLTCLDEKTGKKLWEVVLKDFISDVVYDRYSLGAPVVDEELKRVYLFTAYGIFLCTDFDGKVIWNKSLMEEAGRMTFPNAKVGAGVIEGDLLICHAINSYWGADGPPSDRFFAYDKKTGELVWSSTPGQIPPKDNSWSTPVIITLNGQRVIVCGSGCGNILALNARTGKPIWRYKMSKGGVNGCILVHKNKAVGIHGEENTDNADKGRMVAVKLPEKFDPAAQIVYDFESSNPAETKDWKAQEVWRAPLRAETSSPILVGDDIYDVTDVGNLVRLNADTGEIKWKFPLTNHNYHSSPLYCDGYIFFPAEEGALYVIKPGDQTAEVVQKIPLPESTCLGSAAICNGHVYVHTTSKTKGKSGHLYCFKFQNPETKWDPVPTPEMPKVGPAAALQVIPYDFAMHPGGTEKFRIRSVDAAGFPVGAVEKASWETFIPPTAKVKSTVDAKFNDAGELVAAPDAKLSAGAFKGTAPGPDGKPLVGFIRGRILPNLPIKQDFESFEINQDHPADPTRGLPEYKFAFPPLPWIGARLKFEIRELEGNKVFAKNMDSILFQRATIFMSTPDMSNYTMQSDVMTDGNARSKSDMGLINQRYMIVLRGNANKLEISSNDERLHELAPFVVLANTWYTLKCKVDVNPDGSGVVHAKAWKKAEPEPEAWTLEAHVSMAHKQGSPGIFGFTPGNLKTMYWDNLLVTPNAK